MKRSAACLKRVLDFGVAALLLAALFPFLLALGLLIRAGSPGPALFRQRRVGRYGHDFVLLKFRTMTALPGAEMGRFDPGSSARVTRLGRWLRRSKLDELPQLWNVLRGDMSLVGPRPEVRKWTEVYPERWRRVLAVRPGITDPAAIVFRNEEEILAGSPNPEDTYRFGILPKKLDMYEAYVKNRSFAGELQLIFRTLIAVWKRRA